MVKIFHIKINIMENILFIIGYGKIKWIFSMIVTGLDFVLIEDFG